MRTVNAILAAGLNGGYGTPIVRLKQWTRGGGTPAYNGKYANVTKYELTRFTCKVWTSTNYTAPVFDDIFQMYTLERGLLINGVEYVISSPFMYFVDVTSAPSTNFFASQVYNLTTYDATEAYNESAAADLTAETVINNLLSNGCTAYIHANEEWKGWQYEKTGTTLNQRAFSGLLPQLWNKYTAKMFPRDEGKILFRTNLSASVANIGAMNLNNAKTFTEDQLNSRLMSEQTDKTIWNMFWEDELGATHRLSTTYPAFVGKKLRNIGFVPTTANLAILNTLGLNNYITPLASDGTCLIDLSLEQGDYTSDFGCVSVIESFNMGTKYQWQTKLIPERMYYSGKGS